MPEWLLEKILDHLWTTDIVGIWACIIYGICLCLVYRLLKDKPSKEYIRIRRWLLGTIAAIGIPLVVIYMFLWEPVEELSVSDLILCVSIILMVEAAIWLYLFKIKSFERRKMDRIYEAEGSSIEKLQKLQGIRKDRLLPREASLLRMRLAVVYYELGYFHGIEKLLADCENDSWKMMMQAILAEFRGEMEESQKLLLAAASDADLKKKDHYLWMQLLNNIGRSYRIAGNYQEALAYYRLACDELQIPKERNLADSVYGGYVFNLCLLNHDWSEIEQALDEYRNIVGKDTVQGCIKYNNLLIEAAKQADKESIWKKAIYDGFNEVMAMGLQDDRQRVIFETTSLRLANTSHVNFMPEIEAIRKDLDKFCMLPMPDRFFMVKELFIFFEPTSGVHPAILSMCREHYEMASRYIKEQAMADIDEYIETLPIEAVNVRAAMLREKAGIMKHQEEYSFKECKKLLLDVREIHESNNNYKEALRTSMALADEHFLDKNMTVDFKPKDIDSAREAIEYTENLLENMQFSPEAADVMGQIAIMHIRLEEYEKCVPYAEKIKCMKLSHHHFTPLFQTIVDVVDVVSRVLELEKAVANLKENPYLLRGLSENAQSFLEQYPEIQPWDMALLWGGLLGYEKMSLKSFLWPVALANSPAVMPITRQHVWLEVVGQERIGAPSQKNVLFELDMAYDNFKESEEHRMIFIPNMHPLDTGISETLRNDQKVSGIMDVIRQKYEVTFPKLDENGNTTVLEEIRRAILDSI